MYLVVIQQNEYCPEFYLIYPESDYVMAESICNYSGTINATYNAYKK